MYIFVWLSRMAYCRGFGIQSPSDYWLACNVINEHWPYYQYDTIGKGDGWRRRKLGKLYFRLANWLQPDMIVSDDYQEYFHAGCHKALFGGNGQLVRLLLNGDNQAQLNYIYDKVTSGTVLVVEGIDRYQTSWREIMADSRTGVTFDLYYCGIVLFDKKRYKQNYVINF